MTTVSSVLGSFPIVVCATVNSLAKQLSIMSDTRFDRPADSQSPSIPTDRRDSLDGNENEEYDADRLNDEIEALERSTFAGESGGLMGEGMSGSGM
jgi:hypothetical protein